MNQRNKMREWACRWPDDRETSSALPVDLVRVLEWLRGNLHEAVNLEKLASIAGVRPRTLESHFRLFLGTTPLGWVRRMRLVSARRELELGRMNARVTDIALAHGISQLGRFSSEYRALFGEPPSATLRRSRRSPEAGDNPVDDEALRLTWQSMPHVFAISPRECNDALEGLQDAQRLAPQFGLPVALAAWCWGQRAAHGFSSTPKQDREHGLRLASQACVLAPNDALALTLASGALTLSNRLEEADGLLERALALDPWLPYAWVRRGWASAYIGDTEAAFRELKVALYLSPLGPIRHIAFIGMGCAHFAAGHYEAAVRWVQSGAEGFPGAIWAERVAVAAAVHAGTTSEARRMARRLLRKDPHLTVAGARHAWPFTPAFMEHLSEGLAVAGIPKR
jgi:AraC-like DNA-binding protein